jgi:hypothetical protein
MLPGDSCKLLEQKTGLMYSQHHTFGGIGLFYPRRPASSGRLPTEGRLDDPGDLIFQPNVAKDFRHPVAIPF